MTCKKTSSFTLLCLLSLLLPTGTILGSNTFFQFYGDDVKVDGRLESKGSTKDTSEITLNFDIQIFGSYARSAAIPRMVTFKLSETKEGNLFVSKRKSSPTSGVRGFGASSLFFIEGDNGVDEVILVVAKGETNIPERDLGALSVDSVSEFVDELLRSDCMVFRFPRSAFIP
ncbi:MULTISPECIES: hypothetical protein [unclassified Lentimonas]|uniref:hypothetical protein n=1 Tax=unclassified Lentimonas TaxID=2630993 RepID=UPI00132A9980|nr:MULTISPECIES: hypothetical protein [unclassified Lentimonas]CAA6695095.1 Unannotated [Lentimonas sp. CC19]CAA6697209.1 Unannotated [Lentimonas sp. CC10]CAA7070475.1 Unannotated [Lentimonas sp. CC11]